MPDAFRLDGTNEFLKALEGFARVVEQDVNNHVRNIAYTLTYSLVMETPQYSGAAASAWRVGIGAPELVTDKPNYATPFDKKGMVGDAPFSKRNRNAQAVSDAMTAASFEIGMYTIRQGNLYISNGLDYAQWFEQGMHAPGKALRQQNLPHRAVAQVVEEAMRDTTILRF